MSWLARSLANTLRLDDAVDHFQPPSSPPHHLHQIPLEDNSDDLRGVKDDLTEFKDSVTRQLLGVANFLAPLPNTPTTSVIKRVVTESTRCHSSDVSVSCCDDDDDDDGDLEVIDRVSKEEYVNCESSSLNFHCDDDDDDDDDGDGDDGDGDGDDDDDGDGAVGVTEEVLTFAGNIGHHPETWLDFPVDDDEDMEDFPMSESQKRHAHAVERLTPRLAALRIELCPAHMSMGFFWKVYFVLLHSRLNKQDAALLSTPEIVEARAKWMQEQQQQAKKESEWFHGGLFSRGSDEDCTPRSQQNDHSETLSSWTFASEPASSTTVDSDVEKHVSTDPQIMDKSIDDEKPFEETDNKHLYLAPISKRPVLRFVDNDDDESDEWPEDDCLDQNGTLISVDITDEVSFSDLEDDDCCIPVVSKP